MTASQMLEINKAFDRTAKRLEIELTLEYAGIILRDAELDDIAHYFEYVADALAEHCLGA